MHAHSYSLAFFAHLLLSELVQVAAAGPPAARGQRGIHLPLRREVRYADSRHSRRAAGAQIGVGDYLDVTYTVLVKVGETETPLVIDTGSADLWVVSDSCTGDCHSAGVPLYPHATFNATGQEVQLLYGDSRTGTHARGPIGSDEVGIAGLMVDEQYFAAIVDTNTTVLETGAAGILGLGFPAISILWRQLLQAYLASQPPSKRSPTELAVRTSLFPNFHQPTFPSFGFLSSLSNNHSKRQSNGSFTSSAEVIASFATFGPLFSRLIEQHKLPNPMFATTLQRDTIDIGGNVGMLSIGELPSGVKTDSLTWVPLRSYTAQEGGLPPAPEAPNEVYPLLWEIPLDDVYFDGVKLARSSLSSSSISLSALIDTGNSVIRGPQDVISQIVEKLGGGDFDCSVPHNLSFQIGGKLFPVDPRDFIRQTFQNSVEECSPALAVTDPPGGSNAFLNSWSLGDPFLKSVLAAFYYGNLTHPSVDPPRVGLLSTVPADAGDRLKQVISAAEGGNNNFPRTSHSAPSGTYAASTTGIGGVPLATPHPLDAENPRPTSASNGAFSQWAVEQLYPMFYGILGISVLGLFF